MSTRVLHAWGYAMHPLNGPLTGYVTLSGRVKFPSSTPGPTIACRLSRRQPTYCSKRLSRKPPNTAMAICRPVTTATACVHTCVYVCVCVCVCICMLRDGWTTESSEMLLQIIIVLCFACSQLSQDLFNVAHVLYWDCMNCGDEVIVYTMTLLPLDMQPCTSCRCRLCPKSCAHCFVDMESISIF